MVKETLVNYNKMNNLARAKTEVHVYVILDIIFCLFIFIEV